MNKFSTILLISCIFLQPLLASSTTTIQYIHTDHLGGTNAVTNDQDELVHLLDYYPYGSTRIDNQYDFQETHQFTGYEKDNSTSLNYAGARYQNAGEGRFTGQDPAHQLIGDQSFETTYNRKLELHLSNPQGLNSYSYAVNNPLRITDPDGEVLPLLVAIALAAGGGFFLADINVAQAPDVGNIQAYESKTALEHYSATYDALPGFVKFGGGIFLGGLKDDASRLARQLSGNIIRANERSLRHVIDRHTYSGIQKYVDKSKFNSVDDISSVIREAERFVPTTQRNGNFQRTFDFGRDVGIDKNSGKGTSFVTVITDKDENLITVFPGQP